MILSPDHLMYTSEGEYAWTEARCAAAWKEISEKFNSSVGSYYRAVLLVGVPGAGKSTWLQKNAQGGTLYVDATFAKRGHRAPFIHAARRANVPCEAVWIDTPLEVCLQRNSQRSPDRVIPHLESFHKNLLEEPPSIQEGFSKVTIVR